MTSFETSLSGQNMAKGSPPVYEWKTVAPISLTLTELGPPTLSGAAAADQAAVEAAKEDAAASSLPLEEKWKGSHWFGAGHSLVPITTPEFPAIAGSPWFGIDERSRPYRIGLSAGAAAKSMAGDDLIPTGTLYLFNVIVALEWRPSNQTLDVLMRAFRMASDTLYDGTNGGMAIGQVVFAERQHLQRADVQVLASNRFHPRSMVNGLNSPLKFSPVRLGRGIWRKDTGDLLPWDDIIGARAIAHEWAHYGLGLHDEYIDVPLAVREERYRLVPDPAGPKTVVVPRVLASLKTIMETLDSDELVPLLRDIQRGANAAAHGKLRDRILNTVDDWYPGIGASLTNGNPGPRSMALPLPQFFGLDSFSAPAAPEEHICSVDSLALSHVWLYSYQLEEGTLTRIVAQGRVDDAAKGLPAAVSGQPIIGTGFTLLGVGDPALAPVPDRLLAIGLDALPDTTLTPASVQTTVASPAWGPATRRTPPVVAVLPETGTAQWPVMEIRLRIDGAAPAQAWIGEPGGGVLPVGLLAQPYGARSTGSQRISHMDGLAVIPLDAGSDPQLWVAEYSYGGNPSTTVRKPGAPISAGSSDGNLMIFSDLGTPPQPGQEQENDYDTCIVTTRNYGGFEQVNPAGATPVSYLFAVASKSQVQAARLHPTIVMYFDLDALGNSDLVIHRYETVGAWVPLPTYVPTGKFFAATPLDQRSAPSLVADSPPGGERVEYYRLFAVPKP